MGTRLEKFKTKAKATVGGPILKQDKYHSSHLGDSWRVGMWHVRWKTLGHLSQQRSSPPFWQTAHQSSLGSSSGSAVFSFDGWPADSDCGTFTPLVLDLGGVASGGSICCSWDLDWAPVLLSGRLEPTVTFTYKRKEILYFTLVTPTVSQTSSCACYSLNLKQKASSV